MSGFEKNIFCFRGIAYISTMMMINNHNQPERAQP